jgi:hypothetical protein
MESPGSIVRKEALEGIADKQLPTISSIMFCFPI